MMFAKTFIVLAFALFTSTSAVPHNLARSGHHRGLAHRAAIAEPQPVVSPEVVVKPKRKRSLNKRCAPSNSTASASASSVSSSVSSSSSSALWTPVATSVLTSDSVSASYSSSVAASSIVNIASDIPTPSSEVAPSSTYVAPSSTYETPSSTYVPPTSTYVAPTSSTAASTTSSASSGEPTFMYGTQYGDGTYYAAGLGACGITNTDSDYIVAVSEDLFDNYPGYDGVNPNTNPVCNKQITASYQGKSTTVTVTDRCTGCAVGSLDFTPTAFGELADLSIGRIQISWVWS